MTCWLRVMYMTHWFCVVDSLSSCTADDSLYVAGVLQCNDLLSSCDVHDTLVLCNWDDSLGLCNVDNSFVSCFSDVVSTKKSWRVSSFVEWCVRGMLQRGRALQECVAVVCLYKQARICKLIEMLWQISSTTTFEQKKTFWMTRYAGSVCTLLHTYRHFMWQVCCTAKCLSIYIHVYDIHVNDSHIKCLYSKMSPNRHARKWKPPTMSIQLDRKKTPPRGGFLFTMFPDQEPCVRDFTTRCDRRMSSRNLLHTALDQGT